MPDWNALHISTDCAVSKVPSTSYATDTEVNKFEVRIGDSEALGIGIGRKFCSYKRVKWKDFFSKKGTAFVLEQAFKDSGEFHKRFKQMNNELFPGEGLLDKEHLQSIIEVASECYGNQTVEAFYIFLATNGLEENKLYEGQLSELEHLLTGKVSSLTPSLIYPKDQKWVVNTDYDLPFSAIGGEGKFVDELVKRNKDEIYELKY